MLLDGKVFDLISLHKVDNHDGLMYDSLTAALFSLLGPKHGSEWASVSNVCL